MKLLILIITAVILLTLTACDKIKDRLNKEQYSYHMAVDITSGREDCLQYDSIFIARKIDNLQPGDELYVHLISAFSQSNAKTLFSIKMPENTGYYGADFTEAKDSMKLIFTAQWSTLIAKLSEKSFKSQTDIIGILNFIIEDFSPDKINHIILLSDMQLVDDELSINFEKTAPSLILVSKLEQTYRMPDLRKATVSVYNCTNTHNISNRHWLKIKQFWEEVFKKYNGKLLTYSSGI